MRTFDEYLAEQMKDPKFAGTYLDEKRLLGISIKLAIERQKRGLTQKELANKANITQQQLSRLENGVSCNTTTLFKVCEALGAVLDIKFNKSKHRITTY